MAEQTNKISFATILKGAGITTIAGLVAFLATIFVTKDVFSSAMQQITKDQGVQNVKIEKNTLRNTNLKEQLDRIEGNQKEMMKMLITR